MKVINANENLGGFALKKNKENVDKTTNGTVTSPGKIEVTEVNMPSSQAIKNFSMNLSPYRADFFNPHIHMLTLSNWDIQARALNPLNILSFS